MKLILIGIVKDKNSGTQKNRIFGRYPEGLQGMNKHSYLWILYRMNNRKKKDGIASSSQGNLFKRKQGVFSQHSPSPGQINWDSPRSAALTKRRSADCTKIGRLRLLTGAKYKARCWL